jgi:signal peptidase I
MGTRRFRRAGMRKDAFLFLALAGMATYFLIYYRFVRVPTGSMANTIIPGDKVLCRMHVGDIKRGDIVIFKLPTDPTLMYMHRVIGLPGETIQVKGRPREMIVGKAMMIVDSAAKGTEERSFKSLE